MNPDWQIPFARFVLALTAGVLAVTIWAVRWLVTR